MTREQLLRLLTEHRTSHDPASSERAILTGFRELQGEVSDLRELLLTRPAQDYRLYDSYADWTEKVRLYNLVGKG